MVTDAFGTLLQEVGRILNIKDYNLIETTPA